MYILKVLLMSSYVESVDSEAIVFMFKSDMHSKASVGYTVGNTGASDLRSNLTRILKHRWACASRNLAAAEGLNRPLNRQNSVKNQTFQSDFRNFHENLYLSL
jgi:hypothetical protein